MSGFVHLHTHTEYSLLDGAIRIPKLIERCQELGMDSVAVTDSGVMFGMVDFYLAAKSAGIKPIMGCDMFLTPDIGVKERAPYRLVLLAQNYEGYQNLIHLVTVANLEGFYYKPRIDLAHLATHSEGLIAISPGNRGPVASHLSSGETDVASEFATRLKSIYADRFYLGVQKVGQPLEDVVNEGAQSLGQELGIPLVATNDAYYLSQDRAYLRDVLSCIQTGRLLDDPSRFKLDNEEMFIKSADEMAAALPDYPEALANTQKIADMCHVELDTSQVFLPHFECPDSLSPAAYLEKLVWDGIKAKYGEVTDEIQKRVEFEMGIILKMEYAIYFLIIYDFLDFCVRESIPVGPGRGSAAGSIVAYALNITKIDPIKYKLLFERFLNPERVSMPDVDLDFCIKRRGEVIQYIVDKYGEDHVSQIVTFGTMAARGVVRDVGRVLDVPLSEVDRIAKLIPANPAAPVSIKQALDEVPDLNTAYESSEEITQLLDIGMELEGQSRHSSTHAAGVVISRDPLSKVVPLIKTDGQAATQFSMTALEKIGLLKMDILGLRNLTVIEEALALIKANHGVEIDFDTMEMDDAKTYKLLCSGNTAGVFQLESSGMRALIKDLKPQVFEDVIALLALYRPGPLGSGMVQEFISNKSGKTQVKYDLDELEPILSETYGMIVYQEQVMQIASAIGGFSLGQADVLRRAMGKKKKSEMDRMGDEFLKGADERGFPKTKAQKIFDLCYKFAEYGFNKSHSAAYALISYQTAYLKANYPVEYMTALLSSVSGNAEKTALYISECKTLNISVLPPDIVHSKTGYAVEDGSIRFGLGAIKNVGEGAIESIVENQDPAAPFDTLLDFCTRVDLRQVNKRVIESLIKAGATDSLGQRGYLLAIYESVLDHAQSIMKERDSGQVNLFGDQIQATVADMVSSDRLDYAELSFQEKLRYEKELMGLYVSGHPLDPVTHKLASFPHSVESVHTAEVNSEVILGGMLEGCRKVISKTKREMMLARLVGVEGEITIMLFQGDRFESCAPLFQDDSIVYIKGKVRRSGEDDTSLIVQDISILEDASRTKQVHLDLGHMKGDAFDEIRQTCSAHRGALPVYIHVDDKVVLTSKKYWVHEDAVDELESVVGSSCVWMV